MKIRPRKSSSRASKNSSPDAILPAEIRTLTASSASAALGSRTPTRGAAALEGHARAAPVVYAVVRARVADEVEVPLEPRLLQHVVRVPADREDLPPLHVVVIVERPAALEPRDGPAVHHGLAVILAVRLEGVEPKKAVGGRVELQPRLPQGIHLLSHGPVLDGDGRILHEAGVHETASFREVLEVVPVQRAAEALPPKDFVLAQLLGHAAVGVHVREVELPPRLE